MAVALVVRARVFAAFTDKAFVANTFFRCGDAVTIAITVRLASTGVFTFLSSITFRTLADTGH